MQASGAPSLRFELVFIAIAFVGLLLGARLAAWWVEQERARVQEQRAACLPPSDLEQLHIVVTVRDGKLRTQCLYVGATGTYERRRR